MIDYFAQLGQPRFRARQVWDWIYKRFAGDFDAMTDLPRELRAHLAAQATVAPLQPTASIRAEDRDTLKVLFRLGDGQTIETVLMLYDERRTLCISSQAGCAMGCTFCATAQGGLARNLTPGEIVAQVLYFARFLADPDLPPAMNVARPTQVTNIVLMGMGEPLHNYKHVWTALGRLTDAAAFGLGARHITLSTVGLAPMIDKMADEPLQIGLAVSLHAPDDTLRTSLVPVNKAYPVAEVLAAVRRYVDKTHRRVTFEYALMRGINDSPAIAQELADTAARAALPRQPHPPEPHSRQPLPTDQRRRHRTLCPDSARSRHSCHRAPAPRDRDQCWVWAIAARCGGCISAWGISTEECATGATG